MKFEKIPLYSFFKFSKVQPRVCSVPYKNVYQKFRHEEYQKNCFAISHDLFPFLDTSTEKFNDFEHELCYPNLKGLERRVAKTEENML